MEKYSLIGVDGNAFAIIGYVRRAMKREGRSEAELREYHKKATASDYNNLICVSQDMLDELNLKQ